MTQLKKLFDLHSTYSDITKEETTILAGALEFGSKKVEVVMTPLEKVYMISIDDILSRELIQNMLNEGYSRVPVYEGSREKITGLLFVKDLALLNPDENLSVRKVLPTFGRNFPRVFADTPLSEMLTEFKNGQSHIAVVRRINDTGDGDPTYENIGIITLEDVIEEILQDEIIDETDVYGMALTADFHIRVLTLVCSGQHLVGGSGQGEGGLLRHDRARRRQAL